MRRAFAACRALLSTAGVRRLLARGRRAGRPDRAGLNYRMPGELDLSDVVPDRGVGEAVRPGPGRPLDLDHTMLLSAGGPAGGLDGDSTPILKPVWTLRIQGPDGRPRRSIELAAGTTLLGADPGAGISLAGCGLQSVELRLQPESGGVRVTALGEPGRLTVDGQPAAGTLVRAGGRIGLADLLITMDLELRRM